jgi:signal peptidase I
VVTVPRPDSGRPVTHRIVAVAPVPGDDGARQLTLKGDANSVADTDRYVVETAQRVVFPIPAGGSFAIWVRSPLVMVAVTVLVAGIVAWGLWPARRDHDDDPSPQGSNP